MPLSPFDALSLNWMLMHDMQSEGITSLSHYLPDVRPGAYSVLPGQTGSGSNTAPTMHERHPATPTIGNNVYHIGEHGRG